MILVPFKAQVLSIPQRQNQLRAWSFDRGPGKELDPDERIDTSDTI